jgi:hypothetical protein
VYSLEKNPDKNQDELVISNIKKKSLVEIIDNSNLKMLATTPKDKQIANKSAKYLV